MLQMPCYWRFSTVYLGVPTKQPAQNGAQEGHGDKYVIPQITHNQLSKVTNGSRWFKTDRGDLAIT